jgi:hypothetical protein
MVRVWGRVVSVAQDLVSRGIVVSEREARSIVLTLCTEERVERPADDLLDYLAYALARRTRPRRCSYGGTTRDNDCTWTTFLNAGNIVGQALVI